MKKTKILSVLAVLLAMGITACNGQKSSEAPQSSEQPSSEAPSSQAPSSEAPSSSQASSSSQATAHVHDFKAGPQYPLTEGTAPLDYYECACGVNALQWAAKDYDKGLSLDLDTSKVASDGSIRFSSNVTTANAAGDGIEVKSKIVYQINVNAAVEHAGLDFYIKPSSNNVEIFDAQSNDQKPGKDFVNGEVVDATKRYALYVNDVRVQLGEDPGASTETAWYTWPVDFALKQGVNKIELQCMGGYRAYMFNFRVTGVAKYQHLPQYDAKLSEIAAGEGFIKLEERADTYNSGLRAYSWSALDYDQTKTTERSDSGKGPESRDDGKAIRFSSSVNGSGGDNTKKGTHIVYNVKVPVALQNVGLGLKTARRTDIDTIFDKSEGDSAKGYETVNGEYVRPDSRYGLKVDGQIVLVSKDESGQKWVDGIYWYYMPVKLNLTAGIHEIEIYNLGGYRVEFYNFALTGLAATAQSKFTLGNEWKSDATGHWKEVTGQTDVKFMFMEHRYVVTKDTKASQTANGEHVEKCSICNHEIKKVNPVLSFHTWDEATMKAACSKSSVTEVEFADGSKMIKSNALTSGNTCTLTYTATEAKQVTFRMLLSIKVVNNNAGSGFWYHDNTKDTPKEKTRITVNGTKVTPPAAADDINFKNIGCTVGDTKAADNGALALPVWADVCTVSLAAGENTIVLTIIDTNYSYFFGGAALANIVAQA